MNRLSARGSSLHPILLVLSLGVVLLTAIGLLAAGCGPSPEQVAKRDYKNAVKPILEREDRVWRQLEELAQERVDETMPYQEWVASEGIPAYESLLAEAREARPPADSPVPDLERLHKDLERWLTLRLEFLKHEVANRAVYDETRNSAAYHEFMQAFEQAHQAADAYQRFSEDPAYPARTKDYRFTRLIEVQNRFGRLEDDLKQDRVDFDTARATFRQAVAAPVREMKRSRFLDDEGSRLLAGAVSAADLLYTTYDSDGVMELRFRSLKAIQRASRALELSERVRERYVKQVRNLR